MSGVFKERGTGPSPYRRKGQGRKHMSSKRKKGVHNLRKLTKSGVVLMTAAALVMGASTISLASTGWAEEEGIWVYYNSDGTRASNQWKKYGDNWFYLDSDGQMAADRLIQDGDNYYYVDANGLMAVNQWVAIDNEDAGTDDEPDHYWYYFQSNGKALTNGNNDKVAIKTVNGRKYAFDEEGRMFFGWVNAESAERIDNSGGEGFKDGDYYFGGADDGVMTVGWLQMDVTYSEATEDDYKYTAAAFNDDENQTRWFYFKSNGKKVYSDNDERTREKTINGRKYAFDANGAMVAEWSLDEGDLGTHVASYQSLLDNPISKVSDSDVITGRAADYKYSKSWKYFNSVEDGARTSRGWFKVVPAEYLNEDKYDEDEDSWYYADGRGNICAGEFKTVKGQTYAFRDDGRMIHGLHFIGRNNFAIIDNETGFYEIYDGLNVMDEDNPDYPFDGVDAFLDSSVWCEKNLYYAYYFGGSDDGALRTGKTTVDIDGEPYAFYFTEAGKYKGTGLSGKKDGRLYMSGMLLKADSDDKYQIIKEETVYNRNGFNPAEIVQWYTLYYKVGTEDFIQDYLTAQSVDDKTGSTAFGSVVSKKNKDLSEAYTLPDNQDTANMDTRDTAGIGSVFKFYLVNASGKIVDSNTTSRDGDCLRIVTSKSKGIVGIYVDD